MADIDSIISGVSGNTRAEFPDLAKAFFDAKEQHAKNDLRDAFKGGVPTLPDGSIDYGTMQRTLYQKGALDQGNALSGISARAGELEALRGADGAQPAIVSPPSANRGEGSTAVVARPLNKGGTTPQAAAPQASPQGDQPGSIVGAVSAAGIPDELAGPVIQQLSALAKSDPNAALPPDVAQRIQQVAQAAAQRMKTGQAPQQTGLQPQQAPPQATPVMAQSQPPPQAAPQGFQPPPEVVAAQNDPILKRLTLLSASQDKSIAAAAKVRLESYLKNKEATTEMKNAAASGMTLQQYQEKQGELAASQAGATERAKTDVGEQQEYIKGGKIASDRLTTLNTISNIISSDDKMKLGFGADAALKVQMALKSLGVDVGDLSGPQAITKLNAVLASESAKGVGARPTQFEFKTFLANNPGLSMDKAGNERVIGIYSQLAKREVDLGRLARQNQDNWSNWDNVVEKYDKDHPIKDPKSGRVITTDSIVAPGPKQAAASTFSSPADVHAAIAAGKLKKGDTFQDSNGKTRVVP
jgi:hypothetical protein